MTNAFPNEITVHLGDVFWASMVFFLFRLLLQQRSILITILFSVIFSFGIEISQLYQSDWINSIRNTLIGGLILGRGFLWIDLLRYSLGILISVVIELLINKFLTNSKHI
ncbi:DUF2809 domain-containing protein [Metabacillus sp. FJAT-53654]|uniref:DUF2809 domain-containing protein n=1 Tax=Metabacillus rhizosphaerae TaxID=3117747 RepID=A0ABZ2MMH1_9BACI